MGMRISTCPTDRWHAGSGGDDEGILEITHKLKRAAAALAHHLRSLRLENCCEFKESLCYIARACLKRKEEEMEAGRKETDKNTKNRSDGMQTANVSIPAGPSPPARMNLIIPELVLLRNRTVVAVHRVSCWTGPSVSDTSLLPASPAFFAPLLAVWLRSHRAVHPFPRPLNIYGYFNTCWLQFKLLLFRKSLQCLNYFLIDEF